MTPDKARSILEGFANCRILVVGDLMLDRYVFGSVTRISPEAPVPVLRVTGERAVPGGAANVAHNIEALGGRATLAGLVGNDPDGKTLARLLRGNGVGLDAVVRKKTIQTTVKTRIVAERQQVVRVDREDPPGHAAELEGLLCARIRKALPGVQGVIMEDYGKGVLTQTVVDTVLDGARAVGIPVGLDPNRVDLRFRWMSLATPNYAEACAAAGEPAVPLGADPASSPTLVRVGKILSKKWNCEMLAVTLGPHGMYLVPHGGKPSIMPARAREVYDVSGAGDTVIAAMMLATVAGAGGLDAAALANYAAGVVVGKVGTATCSPDELLAYIRKG
jgi:D-glycero-beta-D-manno-heptose-7-phosphate kinase